MKKALGLENTEDGPTPPLHIKSTCAGLVSSRSVTLHNPSRIPVVFSVEIPAKLSGVFAVTPRVGLLRGNQSTKLTVSFAPWEHKEYRLRVNVKTRAVGGEPMSSLASDSRLVGDAQPASFDDSNSGGCHFIIVAEGSGAVVTFEPPNLDFGCLLVNDLTEKPITLINESDCDVQYELFHRIAPEKKEVMKLRAGSSLSPSNAVVEDDNADDDFDCVPCDGALYLVPRTVKSPKVPALLSVDRPAGILPAHSRTLLKATFQPRRSGDFDIGLCALVSGKDRVGQKISIDAEESAQVRVGDRTKLIEFLRGIPQDDPDFDDEAPLPLSAALVGSASFPTITITDVRCLGGGLGASTRQLWSTLGLEELNHSMSQPLTKQEVKNNRGGIRDKSKLPCFPVKFIPSPLGSPPAVYVFRLTNPGTLTTSFEIHFPNERDIEVPSWADEGEPNEEQLRENRIIDELKSFECYPRSGTLASGESIAITLSYKYDFLDYGGLHSLSLHCVISQGKQFMLQLLGETLPPKLCRLWMSVPPSDQTFRFMPVALGTTKSLAPLQTSELMNTGDSDLEYLINISPLTANSDRADFFQNLYLENPKGVIPARSTHFLKWRFLPLEARQYTYELPIRYYTEGGEASSPQSATGSRENGTHVTKKKTKHKSVLKVAGLGYDPREDDPHAEPPPHENLGLVPPPFQLLSNQGTGILAQLSREKLSLGRLPQRAKIRELLVLRNPSVLNAVEFAWEQTHPLISSGLLTISPSKGKVLPGEFISIKLAVDASCTPRVVETQIAVRCWPALLEEPKLKKSRGGGATSRSATSIGRGSVLASARSSNTRGARSVTSIAGGTEPNNNNNNNSGGSLTLGPIVSRSTKSRDAMLNESSAKIKKLSGKQPKLPSRPPPPPRTGDEEEQKSSNNAVATPSLTNKMTQSSQLQQHDIISDDTQLLHLGLWFEVVDEESFISLFQGDVTAVDVPRPRAFIPDDDRPEEFLFDSNGELSIVTRNSEPANGSRNMRLINSPGETKRNNQAGGHNKKGGSVTHPHHHRSHSEVATSVVDTFFGDLFSDLLSRNEIQQSMVALPKQTKIPYFHDLREHANMMQRLEKAFRAFDLDGSGKLSIKEIKSAILTMGLKAKTSEAKNFMRGLDHDNDGEVDLKEFLAASMPPEVSLALDDAIDGIEHIAKLAKAEERRLARIWMAGNKGSGMKADMAALAIQGNFRARKARQKMELRRQLSHDPDLQEQHKAAEKMQGQIRARKARNEARERHERRLHVMRQVVLGDPDFQGLTTDLVEDSITNLMNEVLHQEFDFGVPPKQYAFANSTSVSLTEEGN